jgi:phage recombination protein Bet
MTKELTHPATWEISPEQIKTLSQAGIIPANTPPAQVKVFAEVCNRHGLDPFTKEAHLIGYGNKYSVVVGINGLRAKAELSGVHAGTDDVQFNLTPDGRYTTAAQLNGHPDTATVTVWKIVAGQRVPFTATVSFKEFCNSKNPSWRSMPLQMISKVAESHALRKAFPRMVSGLSITEEIDAINGEVETVSVVVDEKAVKESEVMDAVAECINALDEEARKEVRTYLRHNWKSSSTLRSDMAAKYEACELTAAYIENYVKGA